MLPPWEASEARHLGAELAPTDVDEDTPAAVGGEEGGGKGVPAPEGSVLDPGDTSPPNHLTHSSPKMIHLTLIPFQVSLHNTEARFFLILFNIAITFILNPPIHFTILVKISQSTLEMTNSDL